MEREYINQGELKKFIERHDLRSRNSIIHFKARVSIKTVLNEILNEEMEVRVSFSGYECYGDIVLVNNDLDPLLFPTEFKARWQKMEYKESLFLHITDTHKKNPSIGKYDVKIVPLRKLME